MARRPNRAETILDAAERRVRLAGYNGVSVRDVAQDAGIKSASLYHHFPSKETLVRALARRYTDRFLDSLADAPNGFARIAAWRIAFRRAISGDCRMCLCGILGAESAGLPEPVAAETRRFFRLSVDHLADGLEGSAANPIRIALAVMAQLEGAAVLARAFNDVAMFDAATAWLPGRGPPA